jgi:hypothetical protein
MNTAPARRAAKHGADRGVEFPHTGFAWLVHTREVRRHPLTSMGNETQLSDALDCLATVVAVGLLALSLTGRAGLPRILLALAFSCYVPGRAVVSNWPRLAQWSEAAMALIFSLAVLALLAASTLWAHYWHPIGLFQAEAGVSLAGLALALGRRHWSQLRRLGRTGQAGRMGERPHQP